jgi:translation elongation factor EF-Ts
MGLVAEIPCEVIFAARHQHFQALGNALWFGAADKEQGSGANV